MAPKTRKRISRSEAAQASRRVTGGPHVGARVERGDLLRAVALFALALVVYIPSMSAGIIWDDSTFVFNNPLIHAPDGLRRIWFTTQAIDYFPLTLTTFWFEWRLWHLNVAGYHVTNIVLHGVGSILLWLVLRKLRVPGAFWAGLLYAVHPVNVASVAWITERKNTLSMVFYLLAIYWFAAAEDGRRMKQFWLSLGAFALALFSKSSTVVLAPALLLYLWWRNGRIGKREILRVAPFFALALVIGLVTVWFQRQHAIADLDVRPEGMASRIAAAGWALWFYLYKDFLPLNLVMVYPRWEVNASSVLAWIPLIAFVCLLAFAWLKKVRWLVFALGYFVLALGPVLGLIPMSFHMYSLVADHLQHLALIAPIACFAAGLHFLALKTKPVYAHALLAVVMPALALATFVLSMHYRDELHLWNYNIKKNPQCWVAYNNLGILYSSQQAGAKVMEYNPNPVDLSLLRRGGASGKDDLNKALDYYNKSLQIYPHDPEGLINRGMTHLQMKNAALALQDYDKALSLSPDHLYARLNRAILHSQERKLDAALQDVNHAIKRYPANAQCLSVRASIYRQTGQLKEALADYDLLIKSNPDPSLYDHRANVLYQLGRTEEALEDENRALSIDRNFGKAHLGRAVCLFKIGKIDEARAELKRAEDLKVSIPEAIRQTIAR